ncbi:AT-rich interactive domain-containing protein 3C [Ornithorhynchus anatinus]|uniref:AT-rich interactive domain-containing protein 3C n=1 Tax=Ornithorhynchus anatinus TaxID=9258 RepID=UPI0019D457F2|nr:AT-rich interactive domain-containing protein 3C [Ornithorhynchus anatinus]
METLQRQQAARLAQRAGGPPPHPASPAPAAPQNHRAARRAPGLGGPAEPPTGGVPGLLLPLPGREDEEEEEVEEEEEEEEEMLEEEEEQEEEGPGIGPKPPSPGPHRSSPTQSSGLQPHEWTYEEQFKQVGIVRRVNRGLTPSRRDREMGWCRASGTGESASAHAEMSRGEDPSYSPPQLLPGGPHGGPSDLRLESTWTGEKSAVSLEQLGRPGKPRRNTPGLEESGLNREDFRRSGIRATVSLYAPHPAQRPGGPVLGVPLLAALSEPRQWRADYSEGLYELDDDPKRKEFLDDLFGFMQKRGTPVNRIPIMAKQVLDLYALFRLVTAKGGLVEVINRKVWREVTKGLSLPTSITSAAFTLRTQYMKYLYPYECETRALSSPGELQAAIDSNRREGRRQGYGTAAPLFSFPPAASAVPRAPALPGLAAHACARLAQTRPHPHPVIKKGGPLLPRPCPCPGARGSLPLGSGAPDARLPSQPEEGTVSSPALPAHLALPPAPGPARGEPGTGEPPEKKAVPMAPEEPLRPPGLDLPPGLPSRATPPAAGKGPGREEWQNGALGLTGGGVGSVNMALEINGAIYTGVLFARRPSGPGLGVGGGDGGPRGHAGPAPAPGVPPHGPAPPGALP